MRKLLCFWIIVACTACQGAHKMSECEKVSLEIEALFAKRAKTPEFEVIGSGGGIDKDKITEIAFTFTYAEIMTLDLAREFIVTKVLDLIDMIEKTPRFAECFDEQKSVHSHIYMAILGQIPDDRSTDFISVVSTRGGRVSYRKIGPIEDPYPYIEVQKETFEEALRIVKNSKD